MPVFGTQNFGSGATSAYEIEKSCIFNGTDAYMSRTPGSAGNQKTMTQSMWVKRGKVTTDQAVGIATTTAVGKENLQLPKLSVIQQHGII